MMNNRKRELLYVLLEEQRIYRYAELCVKLHISERLLRYYIDETNQLLMSHRLPQIIKIRGKGVLLTLSEQGVQQLYDLLQEEIVLDKESRVFSILCALLNDEQQLFAYRFQEKFSMSKSTIDADMRLLRTWMQRFEVYIVSIPKKGLHLQGDEWNIRAMMQSFLEDTLDISRMIMVDTIKSLSVKEQLFIAYLGGEMWLKKIYDVLHQSVLQQLEQDVMYDASQLTLFFALWHKRCKTGHYVLHKTAQDKPLSEVILRFIRSLQLESVSEDERAYLQRMLQELALKSNGEQSKRRYLFSTNNGIMTRDIKENKGLYVMKEKKIWYMNGYVGLLLLLLLLLLLAVFLFGPFKFTVFLLPIGIVLSCSFVVVEPNQAQVMTFLGKYLGTIRQNGFFLTIPFTKRKTISLKVHNFNSKKLKVNDVEGNPIEIGAVIVFRVIDTAKAMFDVSHYESFVEIQSETAIRHVAMKYPYDSFTGDEVTLRGNVDEISGKLLTELKERLEVAGVEVLEARLSHLAYSTEIASAMLQRQQAKAILSARKLIVEGAVSMSQQALEHLEADENLRLSPSAKVQLMNNMLVAIISEKGTQPTISMDDVE